MADTSKSRTTGTKLPLKRGSVEYCVGGEADHEAVYQTLLHVFHGPDRDTFLGALSDPAYRPDQRLLAKVDGRVVSHVHLTERKIRYGCVSLPMNGVMWVGTLPEFRGLGYAHNLMRLASARARDRGIPLQALTTGMPEFYRNLGWGVCGRATFAKIMSRNLPQVADGVMENRAGSWYVRPWRQVELNDLMSLYDQVYSRITGTVVRDEEYWRWMIGRKYAHVIWVACQGEHVRGYAFIKDHRVLELAADPAHPQAMQVLLGRVRAEALERAYPEVIISAPPTHPVMEVAAAPPGKMIDVDDFDNTVSMCHIPDLGRFLNTVLPELSRRARESGTQLPLELGLTLDDARYLIHIDRRSARIEPDKLSRRHLSFTQPTLVRLLMGHVSVDEAIETPDASASTSTALDAARILFPKGPVWRSPLDSATA